MEGREIVFDYAGVRPKLFHPEVVGNVGGGGEGEGREGDFVIQGPKQHGREGVLNLYGIESPGLTSCMAIGEEVAEIVMG